MSSEVFILSAARKAEPAEAVRLAVKDAGVDPRRVQDAILGLDGSASARLQEIVRAAGLGCPMVSVSCSLRAIFFAAQSILSGDIQLAVVIGVDRDGASALILGGPEAVGRWNLTPRARVAGRSLTGVEPMLRLAGISAGELAVVKAGDQGARLSTEVLNELEADQAQWGMINEGELALLLERI